MFFMKKVITIKLMNINIWKLYTIYILNSIPSCAVFTPAVILVTEIIKHTNIPEIEPIVWNKVA